MLNIITQWLAVSLVFVIPLSNALTTVLSILVVVLSIFSLNKQKIGYILSSPISKMILFFLIAYFIAACFSCGTKQDIILSLRKTIKLIYVPLLLPLFIDELWKKRAICAFVLSMLFSMLIIYGKVLGIFPESLFFPLRETATKDGIFTSLFMAFSIFILGHACFIDKYAKYKKFILLILLLQIYYLLFINIGRSGQWIFFALYILLYLQKFKFNLYKQTLSGLLLVMILGATVVFSGTFVNRNKLAWQETLSYFRKGKPAKDNSSLGQRLVFVDSTWGLIKVKPFLGWGPGGIAVACKNFSLKGKTVLNPHNQYLLTITEVGIAGLLLLLSIFYAMFKNYIRQQNFTGELGLGLLTAIILGCFVNSWLLDFASMNFFVVLSAVFISVKRNNYKSA